MRRIILIALLLTCMFSNSLQASSLLGMQGELNGGDMQFIINLTDSLEFAIGSPVGKKHSIQCLDLTWYMGKEKAFQAGPTIRYIKKQVEVDDEDVKSTAYGVGIVAKKMFDNNLGIKGTGFLFDFDSISGANILTTFITTIVFYF